MSRRLHSALCRSLAGFHPDGVLKSAIKTAEPYDSLTRPVKARIKIVVLICQEESFYHPFLLYLQNVFADIRLVKETNSLGLKQSILHFNSFNNHLKGTLFIDPWGGGVV